MASRPNPMTMRDRSGRLKAFVRGNSDAQAHYNAPAPKHDIQQKRSGTPHVASADIPIPTRETLAGNARIPVPRVWRAQQLPPSPQKTITQQTQKANAQLPEEQKREPSPELGEPLDEVARSHRSLFEGSQLGEDFMNSGLTTPQNELEDVYVDHFEETRPEHPKDNRNAGKGELELFRHRPSNVPQFQWSEEGGYMVVKSGPGRQSLSHMKDGFQNGGIKERNDRHQKPNYRAPSPVEKSKNLPIREVKIRRPRSSVRDKQPSKGRPRSPSLSSERPIWQPGYKETTRGTSMVIDLSDDEGSQAEQDALHETPKASKVNSLPHKTLMESSMPPVMNLNRHVQTKKRGRASPDYDDMALSSMTYTELQREPFDLDPAQAAMQNSYRGNADPLATKLDQMRHQSEREQRSFFSSLPMEDWEQSGDWFVERFSDLMNGLRDARREKRRMVHEFEAEASRHEEAVRLRSEAIDQKLVKMRQDGQRVVGDRAI